MNVCYTSFTVERLQWPCGEIGKHCGLKIRCLYRLVGSSPTTATTFYKNKEQNKTMKVKMQVKAVIEVEAQTSDEAFDLIHEITDDSWEIEEIVCLTDGVPNAENSPFNE